MAASESLAVGAAGQGAFDLDQDLAGAWSGNRDFAQLDTAGGDEVGALHGLRQDRHRHQGIMVPGFDDQVLRSQHAVQNTQYWVLCTVYKVRAAGRDGSRTLMPSPAPPNLHTSQILNPSVSDSTGCFLGMNSWPT